MKSQTCPETRSKYLSERGCTRSQLISAPSQPDISLSEKLELTEPLLQREEEKMGPCSSIAFGRETKERNSGV